MWLLYSLFSAILVGCVPILGAIPAQTLGAEKSAVSRAAFVLIGAGFLLLLTGERIPVTNPTIWLIFPLAGLCDALAWLLFYRAIARTSTETAVIAEKVCVPMSILLTCVLSLQAPSFTEWMSVLFFLLGIFYATRGLRTLLPLLSAVCTSAQLQFSKFGIERIGSQSAALFLRSGFSLVFLIVFSCLCARRGDESLNETASSAKSALLLVLSGLCAFFAWSFCFSALKLAPAAKVQALSKLSFWISGLYLSIKHGGINRRHWFAYAAMTIGAFVLIA